MTWAIALAAALFAPATSLGATCTPGCFVPVR